MGCIGRHIELDGPLQAFVLFLCVLPLFERSGQKTLTARVSTDISDIDAIGSEALSVSFPMNPAESTPQC